MTASGGEEEQEPCGMPDDDKLKALKQELHISEVIKSFMMAIHFT